MPLLHVNQLFDGMVNGTPSWHSVYTVPTGYRVVLHNMQAQNFSGSSNGIYYGINSVQFDWKSLGGGGSWQQGYWLVMVAGQQLTVYNDLSAGFHVIASGYLYYV